MKSSVDKLTISERQTLAHFYDTEAYKALKKLIKEERLEIAKDHVDQTDINQVRYLSGQASSLKKLVGTLQQIYKNSEKTKKKS